MVLEEMEALLAFSTIGVGYHRSLIAGAADEQKGFDISEATQIRHGFVRIQHYC